MNNNCSLLQAYVALTFIFVSAASSTKPLLYFFGSENLHIKTVTTYYFCSLITLLQLIPYRHKYPWNYIFLFTLAVGSSLAISTASINHHWHILFKAITATILWSSILSWYAFKTNIDFTVAGTVLFFLLSVTFVGGMVSLSLFQVHIFMVIHASFGIFVFVLFFVYDTQIMIGGKHFLRIEPARHNYITINIYVNMQMLFYYHLTVLSYYYGEPIY